MSPAQDTAEAAPTKWARFNPRLRIATPFKGPEVPENPEVPPAKKAIKGESLLRTDSGPLYSSIKVATRMMIIKPVIKRSGTTMNNNEQ